MRKFLVISGILTVLAGKAWAGTFYDSAQISTPSPLANMGLAGTFNFYASTLPGGKTNPPLIIGSTWGVYAPGGLGIEMSTGTFRQWVRSASMTATGQIAASTFKGDGSGLFNLSTGSMINVAGIAQDTTTLYTQIQSTGISLSRLYVSLASTYTALRSTGVALSNFIGSANSTMSALSVSTASLYSMLKSTGVSLSALWSSALSSYTALTSTAVQLSNFMTSANSTMTALSASTTTLRLATGTLQGITSALTVSTTTLGTSTATLKARMDSFATTNASVSVRIDQLNVFASTGQSVIAALGQSTTAIGIRLSSGAVGVYSNSTFIGNASVLNLGSNLIGSAIGSTITIVAITTTPLSGQTIVISSGANFFTAVSSMVFPTTDFTIGVVGSSINITITGTTHTFTAAQVITSATITDATVINDVKVGRHIFVDGNISSSGTISSVSLSTYPIFSLLKGNQVWQFTTRDITGTGDQMLVIKDASRGFERLQIELSSGLFSVGGGTIDGLNSTTPSSKLDVVGGSVTIRGVGAGLNVLGEIKASSLTITSSATIYTLTTSSFVVTSPSVTINGVSYRWTNVPPTINQIPVSNGQGDVRWQSLPGGAPALNSFLDSANGVALSTMNLLSSQFTRTTAGSSATFRLNPDSVTLQGNGVSISTLGTGVQIANTFISSYNAIGVSPASSRTWSAGQTFPWLAVVLSSFSVGTSTLVVTSSGIVIGDSFPTSKLDIANGSVTIRGTSAALSVQGAIHSTVGGFTFPDGTTQTTASTAPIKNSLYSVIIGTSQTRGAIVVTTVTAGFGTAIDLCASSCSIWVQKGDYYGVNTASLPLNATMTFEDGAVVKLWPVNGIHKIFTGSGTYVNVQVDIDTNVWETATPAVFDFAFNMRVIRPKASVRIQLAGQSWNGGGSDNLGSGLFYMGYKAINASLIEPLISSWTVLAGGPSVLPIIAVYGSSNSEVIRPLINAQRIDNLTANRGLINVAATFGFKFEGGTIFASERVLNASVGVGDPFLKFQFNNNTIYNDHDASSDGLIYLESRTSASLISSSTVFSNNTVYNTAVQTGPTFAIAQPGDTPSNLAGILYRGNFVTNVGASSGPCFKVADTRTVSTQFIANVCYGTSGGFSDSGRTTGISNRANVSGGVVQ